MPWVLGHALYMTATHGGQAKHDTIDAQKLAGRLRGGLRPQADVDPAAMRATRDLRRRRRSRMRQRAALLAPVPQTNRQSNVPAIGKTSADQANRGGVAARFPDPAAPKSIEGDLALLEDYDRPLTERERGRVNTAKAPKARVCSRLRALPGVGTILALVLLDDIHDIQRLPRVPEFVSSCRPVRCATEAAGKRSGPSGPKSGHASLEWAFSDAAVLCLRNNPAGETYLTRLERKQGKGKALTIPAHK
jgi:transposase